MQIRTGRFLRDRKVCNIHEIKSYSSADHRDSGSYFPETRGSFPGELCGRLDLPKTSAYDIVTTLETLGMVHADWGQKKRYTIGLTAYRIGINYTNNLNIMNVMEPGVKKVCP